MHTEGPGIWREILKNVKNEKYTLQVLDQGKKTEKRGNEMQILFDLEYDKKHSKTWKKGKAHCRTWTIARKLKIMENEKHKLLDMKQGEKH